MLKDFLITMVFLYLEILMILLFSTKYLIFCREIIKDAQKYIPEFLENIIEKNLICLNFIKCPNDQLPLI